MTNPNNMLKTLYETPSVGRSVLTEALKQFYGGELKFPDVSGRPYVIGNFVKAVDGPVTFGKGNANPLFGDRQDRLLMSILRALADAVIVGKDTLMDDPPNATWHWKTTVPSGEAELLREFAQHLNKQTKQKNVFVSGSGTGFDFSRGVFYDEDVEPIIATTNSGAKQIERDIAASGRSPAVKIWILDDVRGGVDLAGLLTKLWQADSSLVLLEGGPALYGDFEARNLVDEIFLTQRPFVAGNSKQSPRPTFSGYSYPPGEQKQLALVSIKQSSEGLLFFRWKYV